MPVKIAVAGGLGRMGREITLLALSGPKEFTVTAVGVEDGAEFEGGTLGEALSVKSTGQVLAEKGLRAHLQAHKCDVLLDVTGAEAGPLYMRAAIDAKVAFVSGSTGVAPAKLKEVATAAAKANVAGVWTPNFSVGVNVWFALLGKAAKALPNYDVEIVELHHNQKKDAPSGTAAKGADVLQSARSGSKVIHGRSGMVGARGNEIGVHAVRLGDVVGEHTAYLAGNAERIEITHRAHSRQAFAAGALTAATWVAGRKKGGLYSMADVLGLAWD